MENKSFGSFEKLDVLYHCDDKTLDSVALKFSQDGKLDNPEKVYSLLNALIYYSLSFGNFKNNYQLKGMIGWSYINQVTTDDFKNIFLPNLQFLSSLGMDFDEFIKDFLGKNQNSNQTEDLSLQKKITDDLENKDEFKNIKNFDEKVEIEKRFTCCKELFSNFSDEILLFLKYKEKILEGATKLAQVSLKNWEYLFEYFEKMNKDLDFFKKLIDPKNLNSSFVTRQNLFKFTDSSEVNLLDNIFFNKYKFEMLNGILIENYPENFKEFFREKVNNIISKEDYMTQKKTQGLFSANFERFFNELNLEKFTIKNTSKNSSDTRNPSENMRWELIQQKGRYSFSFASTQEENSLKIEIRVSNGKDYIYEFKDNYLSFKVKKEKAFILDNYYFYFNSEEECALSILMWIYGATEIKENEIYKKLRSKKSDESKP